jgi:hypothetical protein
LVVGIRIVLEWMLDIMGFWKLLAAMVAFYGLHITHVVLLRVVDGFFGIGFLPGVTSLFWQVLQSVVAVSVGRMASWALPCSHTVLPSMSALENHHDNVGVDTGWDVYSRLDGVGHTAFAVTFVLQLLRALRR